jgi:ATP-dependent Clp protease ATP-binding subunit ClpX
MLEANEVEVAFTDGALREVVRVSSERGAGARGLRAVIEEVVSELLFEAPERRGTRVVVDAGYVRRRIERLEGPGPIFGAP